MTLMLSWWYWKGVLLHVEDLPGQWGEGLQEGLWFGERLEGLLGGWLDLHLWSHILHLDLVSLLGDLPVCLGNLALQEGDGGLWLHLNRAV